MDNYLNRTSLRFIAVFIAIIALSLSLFEVLAWLERGEDGSTVPADSQTADPESIESDMR